MLALNNIDTYYGRIRVLKEISLRVGEKEIVTLIGANGAGKSTILKVITGLLRPSSGSVTFQGKSINGLSPKEIVRLGICRVPEGRHVFPRMTVLENLELGGFVRKDTSSFQRDLEEIYHHFPVLRDRRSQLAGTLSGGEQQMLAIGRGLMAKPKLLLLDEPSLGLSPIMIMEIARIVIDIYRQGTTILLIEQNARMALNLSHRAYVLETGQVSLEGSAKELMDHDHVKRAYLGADRKKWREEEERARP